LTNQPFTSPTSTHPDIEFFTDGFVWKDTHFARYAVVTLDAVIKNMTTASWDF
jgi:hypothetical protein